MNVQLAVDSVGGTLCLAPQILNTFAVHSLTRTRNLRSKILCNRYKNNELKSSVFLAASRLGKCSPLSLRKINCRFPRYW